MGVIVISHFVRTTGGPCQAHPGGSIRHLESRPSKDLLESVEVSSGKAEEAGVTRSKAIGFAELIDRAIQSDEYLKRYRNKGIWDLVIGLSEEVCALFDAARRQRDVGGKAVSVAALAMLFWDKSRNGGNTLEQ